MIRVVEGSKSGAGLHVGVAVATWNQGITDRLLQGALDRLQEMEVTEITVLRVPGALELPVAVKTLVESGCDAAIAIGDAPVRLPPLVSHRVTAAGVEALG